MVALWKQECWKYSSYADPLFVNGGALAPNSEHVSSCVYMYIAEVRERMKKVKAQAPHQAHAIIKTLKRPLGKEGSRSATALLQAFELPL